MRHLIEAVLVLAALAAMVRPAMAQVSGSSLLETQVGNFPNFDPDNRQDLYEQLNFEYAFATGRLGGRFETNRSSEESAALPYEAVTLRYVDLADSRFRLRVGNFYTILGRGLVHRSFELTGVVLDQPGLRSRFAPSRDVDGVLAEARVGPVAARLLSGSPSAGDQSIGALDAIGADRHLGQISGGQIAADLYRQSRVGVTYLRSSFADIDHEIGSGFIEVDPLDVLGVEDMALPFYMEYAQIDASFGDWWRMRTSDAVPHALYLGTNVLWGPVGFAAEWKDYSQFRLGTNDPPSLVREHAAALLNRSTHILDAEREQGYQLEADVRALDGLTMTGNLSRADGVRGERFDEHYLEAYVTPDGGSPWEATAFYDGGKDEIAGISDRSTVGLGSTMEFLEGFSATLDVERQSAEREAAAIVTPAGFSIQPVRFEDVYLSLTVARAGIGSVGFVWQRTTDPADPSRADLGTRPLHTFAAVIGARINEHHEATLTAGRRRGGVACTAGTCYEVQPFEGVELRLVSRF